MKLIFENTITGMAVVGAMILSFVIGVVTALVATRKAIGAATKDQGETIKLQEDLLNTYRQTYASQERLLKKQQEFIDGINAERTDLRKWPHGYRGLS